MGQWQFHTPDGVSDALPQDCAAKRRVEQQLRQVFLLRGFQEIETPNMEFYDVYASGSGFAPQEGLFKFFDQQGRILCLRYDGTIPTARVAATLCKDSQLPLRFSYIGNMYRYNESGGGRQREFCQAGVELMGCSAPEADAEVIATAIASAQAAGLRDLQVSIGQVAFFKGLLMEWGIDGEGALLLPKLIDAKETVAVAELADRLNLPEKARQILQIMMQSFGTFDVLDQLTPLVSHPLCLQALANLREVLTILHDYDLLSYISLDLGMLQSLNYYTGIIFKGFTYGIGFPLFSGGRYDQVVGAFGRDLAATGFSIGVNFVLAALRRQGLSQPVDCSVIWLGFDTGKRAQAFRIAAQWRSEGKRVICDSQNRNREQLVNDLDRPSGDQIAWLSADGDLLFPVAIKGDAPCKC